LDKVSAAVLAMSSQLSEQQKHITGAAVGGQYVFALERLCEPGDSLPSYIVQAMARESGGDCAIFESSGGRPGHMLDPKIIAFVLPQEKDDSQYKRLLRGFNDARDQLTKDGPGAVFLGVSPPQNLARSNILGNFAAALKRQLQGTENTRVNFAYVITFEIVRTVAGVMEEIAAGQFVHVNPKHVI
jgi:hypothetical protein